LERIIGLGVEGQGLGREELGRRVKGGGFWVVGVGGMYSATVIDTEFKVSTSFNSSLMLLALKELSNTDTKMFIYIYMHVYI
jgi:hypothetical protein